MSKAARTVSKGDRVYRSVTKIEDSDDESRSILFVASDESEDRHGDIVRQDGWVLDEYERNSVVLWAHDSRSPPIASGEVYVEDKRLMARATFPDEETDEFGARIYRLIKAGFLNAVSVGFSVLDYEPRRNEDDEFVGFDYTAQELFEFSVVSIPANRNALAVARSLDFSSAHIERMFIPSAGVTAPLAIERRRLEVLGLRSAYRPRSAVPTNEPLNL